jgi:glycerol-3-phosphate acyltransferase PlsY
LSWVGLMLGSYMLGSTPWGLLICRAFAGLDPRYAGSGNIGATNVARLAGLPAGAITLLLDMAKGALPVWLALSLLNSWQAALVGLAAFCGQIWPVYLGFKGGKGVATSLGVLLVFSPPALLCALAAFLAGYLPKKFVSLGSMTAAASAPLWLKLWGAPMAMVLTALIMAGLIIWRHKENIARIKQGKERGFSV